MHNQKPLLSLTLNSFVRLYCMDTTRQIAEVSRRMQQTGGYDYYRNLTLAIEAHIDGRSTDEIEYILNSSSKPDEVSYNRAAFNAFLNKFGKKRKISLFKRKASFYPHGRDIEIRVAPTFMVETPKSLDVYHIWATQTPRIDKSKANVACYILEAAFKKTAQNYRYKFFDATTERIYSGSSNTAALAVESLSKMMADWARM